MSTTVLPALAPALARDTTPLLTTAHAELLLARDCRWPWLILVPMDPAATELHHLDDTSRRAYLDTITRTSAALEHATGCQSVNVAMLGNVVAQLHCHVVARSPGDANWPAPIWGCGVAEHRETDALPDFAVAVRDALTAHG